MHVLDLITITVPMPCDPWGSNDLAVRVRDRIQQSKSKQAVRDAVTWVARSTLRPFDLPLPPCKVQTYIPFRTNRRRDPHNYTGTVVKAAVDGLRIAGAWPDDNPDWVTVMDPVLQIGKDLIITLEPRNDNDDGSQP